MAVLETAILSSLSSSPCPPSSPASIITGINTSPSTHWAEADWMQELHFVGLKHQEVSQASQGFVSSQQQGSDSCLAQLRCAASHDEAVATVVAELMRKLIRMFGLAGEDMSSSKSLAGVGVDSLMAIELCNWIKSQLNVDISISSF